MFALVLVNFAVGVASVLAAGVAPAAASAADVPKGMAGRLIAHFHMQRIPEEGAWFAVTYTSEDRLDGALLPPRYMGTPHAVGGGILALVTARDFSAMHRLQTDEVWHFYSGAPLELLLLYPDGTGRVVTLGTDVLGGQFAQFTVPKGVWQGAAPATRTARSFSFFGTEMAPAFEPSDFEIGYRDELQRHYPAFSKHIGRLTRAEFTDSAGRVPRPADAPVAPARAFAAAEIPAVSVSPGMTLQELVGRVSPLATTATLSIAKFTLSPGGSSSTSFNHRSQEVFLVTGGSGVVRLGDAVTQVVAESTVFIPAGEAHSIEADTNSTLTFYAISAPAFSPEDYVLVERK